MLPTDDKLQYPNNILEQASRKMNLTSYVKKLREREPALNKVVKNAADRLCAALLSSPECPNNGATLFDKKSLRWAIWIGFSLAENTIKEKEIQILERILNQEPPAE